MHVEQVSSGRKGSKSASYVGKVDDVRQIFQMVLYLVLHFFNFLKLGCVFLEAKARQHPDFALVCSTHLKPLLSLRQKFLLLPLKIFKHHCKLVSVGHLSSESGVVVFE